MKTTFARILALMLCAVTLLLCIVPASLAANTCKKECYSYARRITKTNTVASGWPYYAKDSFTLFLDKKGNIIGYNVTQPKRDCRPFVRLEGSIKVNYECPEYLIVSSTWNLGFGWNKINADLTTRTFHYKITKDGKLSRI